MDMDPHVPIDALCSHACFAGILIFCTFHFVGYQRRYRWQRKHPCSRIHGTI